MDANLNEGYEPGGDMRGVSAQTQAKRWAVGRRMEGETRENDMAITRSEFDGGKWSAVRPNETADPIWEKDFVEVKKSRCCGSEDRGTECGRPNPADDREVVVFKSKGFQDWFYVEAQVGSHREADDPAISVFDKDHNLIVRFDNRLNDTKGPSFEAYPGSLTHDTSIVRDEHRNTAVEYQAKLPDTSGTIGDVSIHLSARSDKTLGFIAIEAGGQRSEFWPTQTRLPDPLVRLTNPRGPLPEGFSSGSFSESPNIGILVGTFKGDW
ncbi:hypothetical protein IB262_30550 [Ensifer sp. ENS02]|uniref:hypothetical protein n=1 Tax=Ensifer sp. ENS02 TaxID=2769290 RepID=UPI00177B3848|nr:hypothetical protein [Ensifer sp. ENS02]MBD9524231.1 hypothetical protein [Ensifer sp. ENS02]